MNPPQQTQDKKSVLSPMHTSFLKVGFIGQGWIGRNYANDFEDRGYQTVRYSLDPEYVGNKDKLQYCRIIFIAVPTPTTPNGFDVSIVRQALELVPAGSIVVLKSTILPGTTAKLQKEFPSIMLLYAPEFLSEATAAHDAANPFANTIGLSVDDDAHRQAAQDVLAILPKSPFVLVCTSTQAELIKYSHNLSGYVQIVLFNAMYDAARELGADWGPIQKALAADPYISNRYSNPVHKTGRGAGGGCFIKDFAAFRELYTHLRPHDTHGLAMLSALERKNIQLLHDSGKDSHLLAGVYGPDPLTRAQTYRILPPMRAFEYVATAVGVLVIVAGIFSIATTIASIL